jgi:hypothetical protein
MESFNWITILCICGLTLPFIIGIALLFRAMRPAANEILSKLQIERDDRDANKLSILDTGGVIAPATILSARRVRSWGGSRSTHSKDTNHLIDFEAEVSPNGEAAFHTKFREEIMPNGYQIIDNEMMSEHGKKIWVTYDPKDISKAYLDHYDADHEAEMKAHGMNIRLALFFRLTERNEYLAKSGEQVEAVITRMDDVNLMYPMVKSRGIRFYLDVKPSSGVAYHAEVKSLIPEASLQKYSVGKIIYVRFDPLKPERVILDRKRNGF